MNDALERTEGVKLFGKIYANGVEGELELAQIHDKSVFNDYMGLRDEDKKECLTNLMAAEVVNQSMIAPGHEKAVSAVKEGKHPNAYEVSTSNTIETAMDIMRQAIVKTPTFEALMKVDLPELRDAIKVHPEKIASAAADISTETYTRKPAREKVEEGIKQLFKIGAPVLQNGGQNIL